MKKKMVRCSVGLAGILVVSAALAGCGKVTAEKVLVRMAKELAKVNSYQADCEIAADGKMSMSGMSLDMNINMSMGIESWTKDSKSVMHTSGTVNISMLGSEESQDMESYTVLEGETATEYIQELGTWYQMEIDASSAGTDAILDDYFLTDASRWTLAEEPVDITTSDSHSCYELATSIGKDDWNSMKDSPMLQQFLGEMNSGMGDMGEDADAMMNEMEQALSESSIGMTVYVDTKTNQPVRIYLDMAEVMNKLYSAIFDASADSFAAAGITDLSIEMPMTITMDFSRFNEVDEIVVPEEAKNAETYDANSIMDAMGGILTGETAADETAADASSGISAVLPKNETEESSQAADQNLLQTDVLTATVHSDYTDDQFQIDWPAGYELQQDDGDLLSIVDPNTANTAIFYLEEKSLFTESDMESSISDSAAYWKDDEDVTNFSTGERQTMEYNGRNVVYYVTEYTYGGNTDYICYDGYLEADDSYLQFSFDLMTSNSTKDLTPFLQWITIPGETHQA